MTVSTTPKTVGFLDEGVLNLGISASITTITLAPIYKYVGSVKTKGGFNSTAGIALISLGDRTEKISFDNRSVDSNFVTTYSVTRGLDQTTAATASFSGGTGIPWPKGAKFQVIDDNSYMQNGVFTDTANTFTGKQTFSVPFRGAVYATSGDLPVGGNGDGAAYVTADAVFYDYIGGAWSQRATGTTAAMSTTVAGKAEEGTVAEQASHTATGGTGARLVPAVANLVTLGADGTWVSGAIPTLNTAKFLDGSIGGTGVASPALGSLLLGGGAGLAMTALAPGSSGNVLKSNGSVWASGAPTHYVQPVFASGVTSTVLTNPTAGTAYDTHTFTIPTSTLIDGVYYKCKVAGTVAHGTSGTFRFGLYLGGSVTTAIIFTASTSSGFFESEITIMGTAAAGGTASVRFITEGTELTATPSYKLDYTAANQATNGSLSVAFYALFGTSDSGNNTAITMSACEKYSTTAF